MISTNPSLYSDVFEDSIPTIAELVDLFDEIDFEGEDQVAVGDPNGVNLNIRRSPEFDGAIEFSGAMYLNGKISRARLCIGKQTQGEAGLYMCHYPADYQPENFSELVRVDLQSYITEFDHGNNSALIMMGVLLYSEKWRDTGSLELILQTLHALDSNLESYVNKLKKLKVKTDLHG